MRLPERAQEAMPSEGVEAQFFDALPNKEKRLKDYLIELGSVVVAYSGGVDSSVLAYYARGALGARAHVVIAVSPSLASDDLQAARRQAEEFSWDLIEINTNEFVNEDYARNDLMRCYF
jgi:uncharacterized protein